MSYNSATIAKHKRRFSANQSCKFEFKENDVDDLALQQLIEQARRGDDKRRRQHGVYMTQLPSNH